MDHLLPFLLEASHLFLSFLSPYGLGTCPISKIIDIFVRTNGGEKFRF
jgi:hypothetical protein